MKFNEKQVRDFLSKKGFVYTVRGYCYKGNLTNIGNSIAERKFIMEVTEPDDLEPYVSVSGFDSVLEWWYKILKYCKDEKYLYRVKLV